MRGNKQLNKFLQKNRSVFCTFWWDGDQVGYRFIYPFLVSMVISALTFPGGPGKFMSADVNTHDQIHALFSNYTWAQVTRHLTLSLYCLVEMHKSCIFHLTLFQMGQTDQQE